MCQISCDHIKPAKLRQFNVALSFGSLQRKCVQYYTEAKMHFLKSDFSSFKKDTSKKV